VQALLAVGLLARHPLLLGPLLAAALGLLLVKQLRQRRARRLPPTLPSVASSFSRDALAWQSLGVPTQPFLRPRDRTLS
jgi:hypothetical protein